jgi:8-oxo-dGTP pyrophosphatase MutT (NUDIX family)
MKKFTSLKDKNNYPKKDKNNILFSNDHIKVIEYDGWSIIKEKDLVVCIPYLIESNQIVLRYEYIPTFFLKDGQDYHVTLVGGGVEVGESENIAILRELEEEAGIVVNEDYQLESLKPLFMSKGATQKVTAYIIPLNERDYYEKVAQGDGSKVEKKSKSVKVDVKLLGSINTSDLISDYMLIKLKEYLNLIV